MVLRLMRSSHSNARLLNIKNFKIFLRMHGDETESVAVTTSRCGSRVTPSASRVSYTWPTLFLMSRCLSATSALAVV